ncbi:MAG: anti-sigma F factor [Clostridiales bacterium]|nr:anti-sigma F factor [Clostridiales bacterium]
MDTNNKITLSFLSLSENESFARSVASCFALHLNPSVAQISDIKTAVSEAVTNAIVHGYPNGVGRIVLESELVGGKIHINVFDFGVGIENIDEALEPFYTTKPDEERSGMGFTIMKSFMDEVRVVSEKGNGTKVYMTKTIRDDAV